MTNQITILSDALQRVYNAEQIKSISVDGKINCCSSVYSQSFSFTEFSSECDYMATHVFDINEANYKGLLVGIKVKVNNGNEIDILEPGTRYNLETQLDEIAEDVNQWLFDNGFSDTSFSLTTELAGESIYLVQFKFDALSPGLTPVSFVVIDQDINCTETSMFVCQNVDACATYSSSYAFTGSTRYEFGDFYFITEEGFQDSPITPVSFIYDVNNPVYPSPQVQSVKSQFEAANPGMELNIAFDLGTNIMTISITGFTTENYPVFSDFTRNDSAVKLYYDCTENTIDTPTCEYQTILIPEVENGDDFTHVAAILITEAGNAAPTAIDLQSSTIDDTDTTQTLVETWLSNKSYSGNVYFEGTTFTIGDLPLGVVPHSVILTNTNGDIRQSSFICAEYDGVPMSTEFDPTKMYFSPEGLILLPPFYGQEELVDGIYNISIEVVLLNGDIIREDYCKFVDNEVKCRVAEKVLDNKDIYHLYEAIKFGEECNDCDCENMCKLYKELIKYLNDGTTNTTKNLCGC